MHEALAQTQVRAHLGERDGRALNAMHAHTHIRIVEHQRARQQGNVQTIALPALARLRSSRGRVRQQTVERVRRVLGVDHQPRLLEIEIDEQGVDTVGGLFVKLFGRFPAAADMVTTGELMLIAERVEKRRGLVSIVASRVTSE